MPNASRNRTRFILSMIALVTLGSAVGFYMYARPLVQAHEQRVLKGEFERVWVETGTFEIEESGELRLERPLAMQRRTVARHGLVPPGTYQALLLAADGAPGRREVPELVLGARDASGRWVPASAAAIAARVGDR